MRCEYATLLESLYELEAVKGIDFKLERVALTLQALGNPHQTFPSIHIAGTNGKGSVAAMLHAILTHAGWRVGLYTSPHLVRFTERMQICGREIEEDQVIHLAAEVREAAKQCGVELTFFEFVTALAFLHFARSRVDMAVIEVGLGGRLDATNMVDPVASVITTIGLDHQEYLGNTLASVAAEKAGIIKPGRPVIIGRVPAEAANVLSAAAAAAGATAYWLGEDFSLSDTPIPQFSGFGHRLRNLRIALRGRHQWDNAATAIAVTEILQSHFPVSEDAVRHGLASVYWPGRLDIVQRSPLVVLDGAHNLDGIKALVDELPCIVGDRRVHLLFAVMRDKQWRPMVDAIAPLASRVIVTLPLGRRGERPEVIAEAFRPYCPASAMANPIDAMETLVHEVGDDDAIVVAGSLFLLGALFPYLIQRRGAQGLLAPSESNLHA